jgi:hypothetical protein
MCKLTLLFLFRDYFRVVLNPSSIDCLYRLDFARRQRILLFQFPERLRSSWAVSRVEAGAHRSWAPNSAGKGGGARAAAEHYQPWDPLRATLNRICLFRIS